jgi:hypothetical protein
MDRVMGQRKRGTVIENGKAAEGGRRRGSIVIGGAEAKSVGERMGSGERRGKQMWGSTLELRMRGERHIAPIFD